MGPRRYAGDPLPVAADGPARLRFLESYDTILANSEYTRGWIRRLWDRDSDVLFPPIAVDPLYPATSGSRSSCRSAASSPPASATRSGSWRWCAGSATCIAAVGCPGWRLHVVGGCEDSQLPYLAQVRAAAGPADRHHCQRSAPLVQQLLSTSAIFWSATGYGEDNETGPGPPSISA